MAAIKIRLTRTSQQALGLVFLFSLSLSCHASEMGTPGMWFSVLFVLGFIISAVVYLLCAAVFIPQLRDKDISDLRVAYAVPLALIGIPLLFLLVIGAGQGIIIFGLAMGFFLATFIYSLVLKKYHKKPNDESRSEKIGE